MPFEEKSYFCTNQITVDMKRVNILLVMGALLVLAASCSQSSKTQKSNVEAMEQPAENQTPEAGAPAEEKGNADMNPASRLGGQLDQMNAGLTEEQKMKLDEIAKKYDLSKAGSQEDRKAMREQMQNDINSVLTPEQRAKLDENRKARKAASGN